MPELFAYPNLFPMPNPLFFPSTEELTARQVARELKLGDHVVRRLIYSGVLPARSVGRTYLVARTDVEAFRRARAATAPAA